MPDYKKPLELNEMEASLALHALRFYMNAKGLEISSNTEALKAKLDKYLDDTSFVVSKIESPASILGSRGGTKGGVSTSEATRAAAVANGAKGGRPPRPNLCIKFTKAVWQEPDPNLLNALYKLIGNNTWLPDEIDGATEGPYVRVHVTELSSELKELLGTSTNVWEWDDKGLYRFCTEHTNNSAYQLRVVEDEDQECGVCGKQAHWIY